MSKPILMIHEFKKEYLTLPLENYVLTFDDALYSVFYYHKEIVNIKTEKYLFIPTGRILSVRKNFAIGNCYEANRNWLINKDNSYYMTINEVQYLFVNKIFNDVGGHSNFHERDEKSGMSLLLKNGFKYVMKDCELMFKWFGDNLNYMPTKYAYPFNQENIFINTYLKSKNIYDFYGKERIDIDAII